MKLELVDLYNESTTLLTLGCRNRKSLYTVLYTIQHENPHHIYFFSYQIGIMNYGK